MTESPPQSSNPQESSPAATSIPSTTARRIGLAIIAVLTLAGWVRVISRQHRESDQWFLWAVNWAFALLAPILFTYCYREVLRPDANHS